MEVSNAKRKASELRYADADPSEQKALFLEWRITEKEYLLLSSEYDGILDFTDYGDSMAFRKAAFIAFGMYQAMSPISVNIMLLWH